MPEPRRGFRVPPEVPAYFAEKGLKPGFSWLDVWGEEHAYAFTVAKAVDLELLTAFRNSIARAIDAGQGFETWRAGLLPELERLGWAKPRRVADPTGARPDAVVNFAAPGRLQTIFSSNMRAARAAGQWERIQRTKAALPYLLYVRTASAEPRVQHLAWAGTILPADDPWWSTHFPPNGWGCKCAVRQISQFERDQKLGQGGYGIEPPTLEMKPFVNKRTGEVTWVPDGIDPGWQTNPGLARTRTLVTRMNERLAEAGEAEARRVIAEIAASPAPRVLMGLPEKVFLPVAVAPVGLAAELGGVARIVEVSNDTMRAKTAKHGGVRPVTSKTWAAVQEIVDGGEIVDEGRPGHRSIFGGLADGMWQLVVKAADRGRHYLVSSLHAASDRDLERARRRSERRDEG
ncbi:phage minor head protein [uncultured Methylobacterium sp.]|uniref:phage head morphogenesis protein n=1 Tax=uncultured Methylobacterium sp. TaxID=157278 RepID=UPI00258E9F58|nr:phage minor head protein [uncultured Methylobacterium sp.]